MWCNVQYWSEDNECVAQLKSIGDIMIISHKHKFIFIKTKKTAGTSIEIALSSICGDKDIISPISPIDEKARIDLGYRGAQNFKSTPYYNHVSARSVRDLLGVNIWNNYYKFCFERNPWDKVISWYYWEINNGNNMSFSDFISSYHFANVGGPGGYDLYTDEKGRIIINDVFLYEKMSQSLLFIENKLGVSLPDLTKAKSNFRDNSQPYSEIYSAEQASIVGEAFSREICLFGYRFNKALHSDNYSTPLQNCW